MGKLELKDGTRVPGSSTIVGQLDKPYLLKWANKLGFKGINVDDYVSDTAKIGTIIHAIIGSHITKTEVDLSKYKESDIKKAEKGFYKYMDWEKQHEVVTLGNEVPYVSELYKYGGIVDFYCIIDGVYTVVDFKTSKAINNEQIMQVCSYGKLLRENGLRVDRCMILNVPRDDSIEFCERIIEDDEIDKFFELFKHLVDIYYLKKELNYD